MDKAREEVLEAIRETARELKEHVKWKEPSLDEFPQIADVLYTLATATQVMLPLVPSQEKQGL